MAVFPQVGLDEDISAALAGIDPINHPPSGSNRFATEQDLPAGGGSYTDEQAQDAIAALVAAGTHAGITFTYDDAANALSASVTGGGGGGSGGLVARRTYAIGNGAASGQWSAPDAAALDIVGNLDLRALVLPTSWDPASDNTLIAKWTTTGNQRSYQLGVSASGTGGLVFQFSPNGTTVVTIQSPTTAGIVPTTFPVWVRVFAEPNVGGLSKATFYYSTDGMTWTQIGNPVTNATPGPWFVGTSSLFIAPSYTGRLYKAEVYDNATRVATFDATALASVAAFTDPDSRTWTPGASAATGGDPYVYDFDLLPNSISATKIRASGAGTAGPHNLVADGVTGNGTSLEAAVLQAALNAAPVGYSELGAGQIVLVEDPIIIPNGKTLLGQGAFQGGTTLRADPATYPASLVNGGFTTPADTTTTFTITLDSATRFPLGPTGITPPNGIGVIWCDGITIFYTGATATTLTGCRVSADNTSVVIADNTPVSVPMVWLCDPGVSSGGFGTAIRSIAIDGNGIDAIGGIHSSHIQEGGGFSHYRILGCWYPIRTDSCPMSAGSSQPVNWAGPGPGWIIRPTDSPATSYAIDLMNSQVGAGTQQYDSIRGLQDITITVAGSATVVGAAHIRLNGVVGSYNDLHLECGKVGILIGDKYPCVIHGRNLHIGGAWGVGTNDAGVVIGTAAGVRVDVAIAKSNASVVPTRKLIADLGNSFTSTAAAVTYQRFEDGRYMVDGVDPTVGGGGGLARFTATIGDGTTLNYTLTHGLGTKDVIVQCRAVATDLVVMPDIVMLSTTQVTVSFDVAPATNTIRVVVIG